MKQWLAFWCLGLIWGSSFLLIKIAVDELGTLPLVSIRMSIAGLLMVTYLRLKGYTFPTNRRDLLAILIVGFFNVALPFSLITRAEESIDSSLATILNSTVPLFSLVIAHFALKDERLNRYKMFGLLIGYVGILILTWRGLSNTGNSPISGQIMMLAAAASYASAVIFIRARLRHLRPLVIAGLSLAAGAFFEVPLTLIIGDLPDWGSLHSDTIAAILTLAVINTVIAYFLFYYLIGEWGARATMVTYTFPPVGITLGALFLDEAVDFRLLIGAALILLGVFAVNYKGRIARAATIATLPPQPASQSTAGR
jgi:drug/metabolite transporter (DMT)-like permease